MACRPAVFLGFPVSRCRMASRRISHDTRLKPFTWLQYRGCRGWLFGLKWSSQG